MVAETPQNVTRVVAMFVPKWPPLMTTVSPPFGEPELGTTDEMKMRFWTQKKLKPFGTVMLNGVPLPAPSVTTTSTASRCSGGVFAGRSSAGVRTTICVFETETTVAGFPPNVTRTDATSLPKRPPLIVTVSPSAHEPEIGKIEEMNGLFPGTDLKFTERSAVAHSRLARTCAAPTLAEPSVTSATPPTVVLETDARLVSKKKPKSVVKMIE